GRPAVAGFRYELPCPEARADRALSGAAPRGDLATRPGATAGGRKPPEPVPRAAPLPARGRAPRLARPLWLQRQRCLPNPARALSLRSGRARQDDADGPVLRGSAESAQAAVPLPCLHARSARPDRARETR